MRRGTLAGAAVVIAAAIAAPPVAEATYEGRPGRIAYASARPRDPDNGDYSGVFDLYTRKVDGSGIRRLTRSPDYSDRDPSWSPGGRRIVWSCRGHYAETDPPYVADICLMDADGGNKVRFGFETSVASPEFSPDGKRIAYVTDGPEPTEPTGGVPGGVPTDEVWVMDRDGSGRTQVTTNTVSETAITWSPDGTEIAFVTWDEGGDRTGLYVVDVATGEERLLAEGVEARPLYRGLRTSYVDWSPDGRHVLFLRSDDGDGSIDVYVIDPEDGAETQLTADVGEYELSPAWAPDGDSIVFRHTAEGTHPETGADPSCIIPFPRRRAKPIDHARDCPLHSVVEHDYAWGPRRR